MRLESNEDFEYAKDEMEGDIKTFQIKATPVIFKLMSKDIYRDKRMAVIRELITNAVDAMAEAGTLDKMQYKINVPNSNDLNFWVRDYGTGLDDDGVRAIYTYGDSSRNTDNRFIGAFGIGAKAPFAYTKKFYVEAFKDKVKRSYEAFLVEGVPVIKKTAEEPTDELNGVKVIVPVEPKDCSEFYSAICKFYRFYKHIPASNFNINAIKVPFEPYIAYPNEDNPLYALTDDYSCIHVVMGGIEYKAMDMYDFNNKMFRNYNERGILTKINKALYIFASVGKYPVLPSREEIDMSSETTFQILKDDYSRIESIIAANLRDKFYKDMETDGLNGAAKELSKLIDKCYFDEILDPETCERASRIASMFKNKNEVEFGEPDYNLIAFATSSGVFVSQRSYRHNENDIGDTVFLVRDYRSAVNNLPPNFVSHSLPNDLFNRENYAEYVKQLAMDQLGYPEHRIKFLSSIISKPEPVKRPKGVKRESVKYDLNNVKGYSFWISKDDRNIDTSDVLAPIDLAADNSFYVSFDDMKYSGSKVRKWISMLNHIRIYNGITTCETFHFYGISINYVRKFAKDPEFMYKHSLIDYVKKFLAETEMPQFKDKYLVLLHSLGNPRNGYEPSPIAKDVLKYLPFYRKHIEADCMEYTLDDINPGDDVKVRRKEVDCKELDYIMELIDYNDKTKYFVESLSNRKESMFRGLEILKYLKAEGKLEDFFPADPNKW